MTDIFALTPAELQAYLREQMPLVDAMDVRVAAFEGLEPTLVAPLAPNRNHGDTFFGGSMAALAILAGWAAVHLRMKQDGVVGHLVIQRSEIDYLAPIDGEMRARARAPDPRKWARFRRAVERKGRGRIRIEVIEEAAGKPAIHFRGDFVVLNDGNKV